MDSPEPLEILKLCECLYSLSSVAFQKEVNKILSQKIHCENTFILFISEDQKEFYCEVIGDQTLAEEMRFGVETSDLQFILKKKTSVFDNNVKNFCLKYNSSSLDVNSYLAVPLFDSKEPNEKVMSLLCLINKKNFTVSDLQTIEKWAAYISPLLIQCRKAEEEKKKRELSQRLLEVVKTLLVQIDNVTLLLKEIMVEARNLIGAERCSLFLLDKDENMLVAKVFDGIDVDMDQPNKEICFPASEGIAGHVVSTGDILNISDAYSHPLFYRKVDEETGFKTRNILCFPIKDDNVVIGVAELCNKIDGRYFTQFDEELAGTFSVYCAICIMHSLMWQKVRVDHSRNRVSSGLLMQTKVSEEEILTLASKVSGMTCIDDEFKSFKFIPRLLSDNEAALAVLGMFDDLGFVKRWKLKKNTLVRFVVMVKQGYRDPPYHNWKHGFSVAHFSYLLLKNLKLMENKLRYLFLCIYIAIYISFHIYLHIFKKKKKSEYE